MKIFVWWKDLRERLEFSLGHVSPAFGLVESVNFKVEKNLAFPYDYDYEIKKPFSIEPSSSKVTKDWFVSIADFEFKKFAEGVIFIVYPSAAPYSEDDFKYMKEIAELYKCNLDYEYKDNSNILIEVSAKNEKYLRNDKKKKFKFERTASKDEIIFKDIYAAIKELKPHLQGASVSALVIPSDIIIHPPSPKDGKEKPRQVETPVAPVPSPSVPKEEKEISTDVVPIVTPQNQYEKSFYAHMNDSLIHRKRVFEWQLFSSKLLFFTVLLLVIIGIYFSWLQFRRGINRDNEKQSESETRTELEISTSGFKVKSSILGVIILIISLAFFYLYLAHVYPIDVVPLDREVVEIKPGDEK